MCNKFKKPTCKAGSGSDFVLSCQHGQVCILKKYESSLMGEIQTMNIRAVMSKVGQGLGQLHPKNESMILLAAFLHRWGIQL